MRLNGRNCRVHHDLYWKAIALFLALGVMTSFASVPTEDKLIDDIIAGDAGAVAKAMKYPLEFPYPLASITNEAQFVQAFPVIFDKVLRRKIKESKAIDKWEDMGWRGRMYANGMLWKSSGESNLVSTINYFGGMLHGKWLELLNRELSTLPNQYRKNVSRCWTFKSEDGKWWGRLDVQNGPPRPWARGYGENHYDCRLMLYMSKPNVGTEPSIVCMCSDTDEGFVSKDGKFGFKKGGIGTADSPSCWLRVNGMEYRGEFIRWPFTNAPNWNPVAKR